MKKLTKREVWWIIKQMKKGELSVYRIAKIREISSRWVRHIWKFYQDTGEVPYPKKCGRKTVPISIKERALVKRMWKIYPCGAVCMERLLKVLLGIDMPHNKIHKIMKEEGLSQDDPKKQEKRKWVRYERKHSNSLWHVDWSGIEEDKLILYEDDASRFITGYGVFSNATLENSLNVFKKAVKKYGAPKQLLSDNGTQFRFNEAFDRDIETKNKFQKVMKKCGVQQIFTRVKRPQANGKVERLFQSIRKYAKHFGSVRKAVNFYNYKRLHMSLDWKNGETPYKAFLRKRRK